MLHQDTVLSSCRLSGRAAPLAKPVLPAANLPQPQPPNPGMQLEKAGSQPQGHRQLALGRHAKRAGKMGKGISCETGVKPKPLPLHTPLPPVLKRPMVRACTGLLCREPARGCLQIVSMPAAVWGTESGRGLPGAGAAPAL